MNKAFERQAGDFVRVAKTLATAHSLDAAIAIAQRDGASDAVVNALRAKAASAAGTFGTWGGPIADDGGAAAGFVESIRPASLFYRFSPMASSFPLHERTLATAALEVGSEIGEGAWTPVVMGSFTEHFLKPRKTGGIIVFSKSLVRQTDPASFATVRRELQRAAIASVDAAFLSVAEDVSPGTATSDVLADLRSLLANVNVTSGGRLLWAVAPDTANSAATAADLAGARVLPEMTPLGGSILGLPAVVTDRLTAGRILLLDASGFLVNEGDIDVSQAEGGALKMTSDPADGPGELISLFQAHLVALKVIATFAVARVRDDAVAGLDGAAAAWGGGTAS